MDASTKIRWDAKDKNLNKKNNFFEIKVKKYINLVFLCYTIN